MNAEDVLLPLVVGLSVALLLSGAARSVLGRDWPVQTSAFRCSHGLTAVALALIAGPGILIDRLIDDVRDGRLEPGEFWLAGSAACLWAMLYGYVLLHALTALSVA